MKKLLMAFAASSMVLSGCATPVVERSLTEDGREIAEQRCSSCHAIGLTDASARAGAPPLRDLYKRYALEDVRRAFSEGVHVGHPDMPTFHLEPGEVDRLVAYLRHLDPCAQPSSDEAAVSRCFAPL
jgi:mono/diheme cytochrome c family protein